MEYYLDGMYVTEKDLRDILAVDDQAAKKHLPISAVVQRLTQAPYYRNIEKRARINL